MPGIFGALNKASGGAPAPPSGSPLIDATVYRTMAALSAGLAALGAGATGALFEVDATTPAGRFRYDGSRVQQIGRLFLTGLDGTEGVLGLTYNSPGAAWQTPGASGGLLVSGEGLVTFPALSGRSVVGSVPPVRMRGQSYVGAWTDNQTVSCGLSSALDNEWFAGGVNYNLGTDDLHLGRDSGVLSAFTHVALHSTSTAQRIAQNVAAGPTTMDDVELRGLLGWKQNEWLEITASAYVFAWTSLISIGTGTGHTTSSSPIFTTAADCCPCLYLDNQGDTGFKFRITSIDVGD